MIRTTLLLALSLSASASPLVASTSFFTAADVPANGFAEKVAGENFDYATFIPDHRTSLIVRATLGKDAMTWKTDPAPQAAEGKTLAFVWLAALGSSPGRAAMDISINGEHRFTFHTDGRPQWELTDTEGRSLQFQQVMTDQHGDHHGYMILRLPAALVKPGETLTLGVCGHADQLSSWYMTFTKPVRTGASLKPWPAILKNGGQPRQLVGVGVFYFGPETEATIHADGRPALTTALRFGYNSFNLGLQPVDKPTPVELKITAGGFSSTSTVTLEPVRKWSIDFIQHSHTDIGYTRSQPEILAEHLCYLDYALDYCDATDSLPENARFRWTCEAAWPVDEYLRCRPTAQVERLKQRIKEGRIEVTAMYFNLSELPDERTLAASLKADILSLIVAEPLSP